MALTSDLLRVHLGIHCHVDAFSLAAFPLDYVYAPSPCSKNSPPPPAPRPPKSVKISRSAQDILSLLVVPRAGGRDVGGGKGCVRWC